MKCLLRLLCICPLFYPFCSSSNCCCNCCCCFHNRFVVIIMDIWSMAVNIVAIDASNGAMSFSICLPLSIQAWLWRLSTLPELWLILSVRLPHSFLCNFLFFFCMSLHRSSIVFSTSFIHSPLLLLLFFFISPILFLQALPCLVQKKGIIL